MRFRLVYYCLPIFFLVELAICQIIGNLRKNFAYDG